MTRLVVLLPPSEGKADGGDGPPFDPRTGAFAVLERHRGDVRKALRHREFDAVKELGVGPVAAGRAMERNRRIASSPTMPALCRYTGVLYGALGYKAAPVALRRRLDAEVVVVSGLWGLLRGDDQVPDYKLPIGARLPGLGRLAGWWRPRLSAALAGQVAGAVVWNLLPAGYAAACPETAGAAATWNVRVLREHHGRRAVVGHDGKSVKGALARALVAGRVRGPDELAGWTGPGGYQVRGVDGTTVDLVTRS